MMTKIPLQVNIPRRAQICARHKEPLAPSTEYFSVLLEGLSEGTYTRYDYCPICWKLCNEEKSLPPGCSFWKAVVPSKKQTSELPKQRNARALVILKNMLEFEEENFYQEAFVLSLYLARRRQLYLRQEILLTNGSLASLYEVPETEEILSVKKLTLSTLEVEKIQLALAQKMK